jgi:hypothetical protein
MNINLIFEIILILFAILASNGIIYSLGYFNKQNSSKNISVITNSSEKDGLALTSLIASNPIRLTSEETNGSQTVTLSETNGSQTVTSSEINGSQDILDNENIYPQWVGGTHTENSYLSSTNEENLLSNVDVFDNTTSLESLTILDSQSVEQ